MKISIAVLAATLALVGSAGAQRFGQDVNGKNPVGSDKCNTAFCKKQRKDAAEAKANHLLEESGGCPAGEVRLTYGCVNSADVAERAKEVAAAAAAAAVVEKAKEDAERAATLLAEQQYAAAQQRAQQEHEAWKNDPIRKSCFDPQEQTKDNRKFVEYCRVQGVAVEWTRAAHAADEAPRIAAQEAADKAALAPIKKTWDALGLRLGMSQGQVKAILVASGFKVTTYDGNSPNHVKVVGFPWVCEPGWNGNHTLYGVTCLAYSPTGTKLMMQFILGRRSISSDTGMATDTADDRLIVAKFAQNDSGYWSFDIH